MRMKRIQRIMEAVRIHQEVSQKQSSNNKVAVNNWEQHAIENKVKILTGRIAASRKRARDLWNKGR